MQLLFACAQLKPQICGQDCLCCIEDLENETSLMQAMWVACCSTDTVHRQVTWSQTQVYLIHGIACRAQNGGYSQLRIMEQSKQSGGMLEIGRGHKFQCKVSLLTHFEFTCRVKFTCRDVPCKSLCQSDVISRQEVHP